MSLPRTINTLKETDQKADVLLSTYMKTKQLTLMKALHGAHYMKNNRNKNKASNI